MKYFSIVLYPDNTFERRATFYPSKSKKHWGTTWGNWARTPDGRYCLTRTGSQFHDPNSSTLFMEGSCFLPYLNARGTLRVDLRHANGKGFDAPAKFAPANDGFHFPSTKALKASGATERSAKEFLTAASGRSFYVDQWTGLSNFLPHKRGVFTLTNIADGKAHAKSRGGHEAKAAFFTKGKLLCTAFKMRNLWADGCGTVWQATDGRFYITSEKSGFAYVGGILR